MSETSGGLTIGTYDTASLAHALLAFQVHYRVDSATFFQAYLADAADGFARPISGRQQHRWASYYREWLELTGAESGSVPEEDALTRHTRDEIVCA